MATATPSRPAASGTPQAMKKNWASEIITASKAKPAAVILFGVPGIGKSSMAAQIPGVVGMHDRQEDGFATLIGSGIIPQIPLLVSDNWTDTLSQLDWLATGEHSHKAITMDTLGGYERQCHEYVCARDFQNNWGESGFIGYQRGYDVALGDWRQLLQSLDRCRARGMTLFLLAHAKVETFKNPSGPDYDKWSVDVNKKTWGVTHKWADMVLFANFEAAFKKGDEMKSKAKAHGGQARVMYTENCAAFDAKNRHNLPPEIDMGNSGAEAFANLVTAIKAGKLNGKDK